MSFSLHSFSLSPNYSGKTRCVCICSFDCSSVFDSLLLSNYSISFRSIVTMLTLILMFQIKFDHDRCNLFVTVIV
jgi:hypothetical protein